MRRRRNLHWSWCRGPLGESRHLDGEVEGAVALLGFGGVCSGLDLGLNPSNKRVRNRFGARETDLAARERNLAGGSGREASGAQDRELGKKRPLSAGCGLEASAWASGLPLQPGGSWSARSLLSLVFSLCQQGFL